MPCGCATYECLEAFVNPCNAGTDIGITATETGSWNAQILFNGKWTFFAFQVDEGEAVIIPTVVLNEDYVHELRLTNTEGVTTCYHLRTAYTSVLSGYEPVPPISSVWQWGEVEANGNIVDSELLGGDLSPIIWINQNPTDWEEVGITREGDELDFTAIGGAFGKIIFQYRNLP